MCQSAQFSSGIELASFVTSSGLLQKSLDVITSHCEGIISKEGEGLSWKVYKESFSDLIIIAFEVTSESNTSNLQANLVPSSDLREMNFHHFDFLCTRTTPNFSINNTAFSLFYRNHQRIEEWKNSEINSSTRLIVTGHGLGGSIASLFTISLVDSIGSGKNRPLCITYGSPLIGDKKFQQAISRSPNWNSCFLHVVSHKDSLPTLFITNHSSSAAASSSPQTSAYMPFGTFFLCSDANSTCLENPDFVLELLISFQPADYRNIVENLIHKVIYKDTITQVENFTRSDSILECRISLQLQALGLTPLMQHQQQKIDINNLKTNNKKLEENFIFQKRVLFDPSKKLNKVKVNMAQLEWYKKETKNLQIGYYDSYKIMKLPRDHDAVGFQKNLTKYWKEMVEEVEMTPQSEFGPFRTRWLYAGTNYRRMVEPLDIAEYYREDGERFKSGLDYVTNERKGRSRHYNVLELLEEEKKDPKNEKKDTKKGEEGSNGKNNKNVELILTIDSCFWVHVEEALISCKVLEDAKSSVEEKEEANKKLLEFENYVYGMLKKYEVSPEIFLDGSSYMSWWNKCKGTTGNAALADFMSNRSHCVQYTNGTYDFP